MKIPKLKFKLNFKKFSPKMFLRKKVLFSSIGIIAAIVGIYFYVSLKSKPAKAIILPAHVQMTEGALQRGDVAIISPISTSTSDYTSAEVAASFVGNMYKLSWKSGLDTMARSPIYVWLPIPSNYYFGENTANVQAIEIIDGMPYTLYGGQIRTKDGTNYLECVTYFPGIIGLTLTNYESDYGLKLVKKVGDNSKNLIIVPGSNMNFVGNIPGTDQNIWAQNFPNYNVYVFTYPLITSRSLSTTAKIMNYFMKTGTMSYVKYTAKTLSDLLSTVVGDNYIIAQGIGGLIVREAVENQKVPAKKIILFDTPNQGTSFASSYMLSNLYNAGDLFISREMALPQKTVDYVMNISVSYLRLLNFFAQDMDPNSDIISELNSKAAPSDIDFVSIAGTKPNISIQTSKKMESFFPQLVPQQGDGVVSVKSALSFGEKKYKFPYSFYDIFMHKDVQTLLKSLLSSNASSTSIEFSSDKFKETAPSTLTTQSTKSVTKIKTYKYLSKGDYFLREPEKGQFIEKNYYINVPPSFKIMSTSNGVYLISNNKAYFMSIGGYQLVYKGNILFSNTYKNTMYLVTSARQVIAFNGKSSKLKDIVPKNDYQSIFVTDTDIYALINTATSTVFMNLTSNSKLLTIPGKNGRLRYFPSTNQFAIVTDKYVSIYDNTAHVGTFFEKIKSIMEEIEFGIDQSIKINSIYIKDDLVYLLSSNYMLIAVDMQTHRAQVIGNQDVGNVKLLAYKNILIVVGDSTLNFYDMKNRVRIPIYQKNSGVIDATSWNNTLLLLCDKEGKYEIDGYEEK